MCGHRRACRGQRRGRRGLLRYCHIAQSSSGEDLACGDGGPSRHVHAVRHRATLLDDSALVDDSVEPDGDVVPERRRVDDRARRDQHAVADGDVARVGSHHGALLHRGPCADLHLGTVGLDACAIPDRRPRADLDLADDEGGGGDEAALIYNGLLVRDQSHHLPVPRQLLKEGVVALEAAAQALEGDAGLADHLPDLPYRSRHGALGWWWREAARRR
mmetsp:Transcript_40541/g.95483  ORF Transcript_40541/g.95483 Transcript_40541/m.95483 type:complete len:217 (-) Transcript_40541:11-661(-)